jgi:phosphoribosylglycinamide formyltransferase-1
VTQQSTLSFPLPVRVVVLLSGTGTLLQALLDATEDANYPVRIVAVGSDRAGVEGLARAERASVPGFVVRLADHPDRDAWDVALADAVAAYQPDLVVSAGFMKIVGPAFLDRFAGRMINTHPAAHAVQDAVAYGVKVTGCTVHLVDKGVDTGPILAQQPVVVEPGEQAGELHARIKAVERRLLVEVVARLAREGATVNGRKVSIP